MNRYVYSVTNKISYWLASGVVIFVGYTIERVLVAGHGKTWVPNVALIIWIGTELYWSVYDLAHGLEVER
jgi:hypothetical protein